MNLSPITLLVLCGIAVVGFFAGRMTVSQSDEDFADGSQISAAESGVGFASGDGGSGSSRSGRTSSIEGSRKFIPIKSAAELREELQKMQGTARTRGLAQIQDRLGASDIAGLVQEIVKGTFSPRDMQGLNMLISALAEKDPEAAWNLATSLPTSMRNSAMTIAIGALAEKFPDIALSKVDAIESVSLRRQLRQSLLSTIAQSDPRRALDLLGTPQAGEESIISSIFTQWARNDAQAAQAALAGLDDRSRAMAISAIATALAETDPAAAWKLALTAPLGGGRYGDPRYMVLHQWARVDPKAAMQAIAEIPEGNARNNMLSNAFRAWADADYNAALKYVMGSSDPSVLSSGLAALAGVAGGDKASLLKTILENVPSGSQFQRAIGSLMNSWASEDPRAAAAAVAKLPPGNAAMSAIMQVAMQWIQSASDKNEPLQWALSMSDGQTRQQTLSTIFGNWASTDPAAAAAAAMRLSNEDRANVLGQITSSWAQNNPQAVIDWASRLTDPQQRQSALQSAVTTIASNDPHKAIAMLNSLGLSNDANTIGNIVQQWVYNDISAASAWVRKLPDGDIRDRSLGTIANRLSGDDPESAVAWAAAISNPKSRISTIENVVRQWKHYDATAANAWVVSSNLPEENKTRLLQQTSSGRTIKN